MKALEPTRIIHSEGSGPYAYKTRLGCVVGPINCISKGITTSCNFVAVRDVASSKLASHHFAMEKSGKDVSLEEMFQAMYRHDKKWLCRKVRCIIRREDLVYPSPWSVSP